MQKDPHILETGNGKELSVFNGLIISAVIVGLYIVG